MRRITQVLSALIVSLALLHVAAGRASADELYGKIRGAVTDASGAAVPGAAVTVTNRATGISRKLVTGDDGSYIFLNLLAPADYDVTVEATGFKKHVSQDIHLNVNQTFVADAQMQVGGMTEEVTVHAATAQINTTSMQLGASIQGQQIVDLPLNGRNWIQLQQLQPGVVASSDRFGTNFSTNGAETQQNSFLVNGVDSNDIPLNSPLIIPSPDAIGEFRMVTNTINPEFGRNSGAIINAIVKSGTNQWHGDAFEFYRDTSLDARNFYQKTVSPFHQNQFGGTVGGPIWKDHTFFFFSYQGTRATVPQGFAVPTVFSSAQRSGAFTDLSTSTGISATALTGDNGALYPAGTPYSTLFPNNQIPTADLNPLALKLMNQYVPLPNAVNNGYTFNPSTVTTANQYITRIDHTFSSKDSIWGYWFWQSNPDTNTLPFTGSSLPGFADTDQRHSQEYTLDWNHIFNGSTINEARIGYSRFNFVAVEPVQTINPTSYGFTGINPQVPSSASLPVISLNGYFTIGFSTNGPQPRIDQTTQFIDNFSKVSGNHTFKAGFTLERFNVYNPFSNSLSGNFSFNGSGTFTTGDPGADFLLGVPDSYGQGSGSIINARAQEYYSYAQDEWKLRPNFTLTYGMGWDIETPYNNLYGAGEAVNAFRSSLQSTVFPTAPAGLLFPGDYGITNTGGPGTPYHDLAPRIGFAWSPDSARKWSVHAGFGIYYNRAEEELALQNLTAPPFSISSAGAGDLGGSPNFANPYTGYTLTNGNVGTVSENNKFPFSVPTKGSPVNFAQYEPFSLNLLGPNFGVPMSMNYNLTVERQLSTSTVVDVAFVGNQGRHLLGAYELNPAGAYPGVNPGAVAAGCNAFDLGACSPGSFNFNPSIYASLGQQSTDFNSYYNSLQASITRQFTNGLQFSAAYTWSHYMDMTSSLENSAFNGPGINPFDFASMWANSANDAPNRLVINYDYDLPFYHFFRHAKRAVDGWKVVGITTFQSGFPVSVLNTNYQSNTCYATFSFYACPDRANLVSTPQIGNPRNNVINGKSFYWFNPSAFSQPAAGTIGNAGRNPLFGPGINNFDFSLIKDLAITESKYFEFRFEFYNIFNQVEFGSPNGNFASANFGRILGVQQGSTNGNGRVVQLAGKFYF